eukprot:m.15681 g.15681  ORF g.15681 m.15681 type:complete len:845 (+) comp26498_c0_seq3:433-2967(+)
MAERLQSFPANKGIQQSSKQIPNAGVNGSSAMSAQHQPAVINSNINMAVRSTAGQLTHYPQQASITVSSPAARFQPIAPSPKSANYQQAVQRVYPTNVTSQKTGVMVQQQHQHQQHQLLTPPMKGDVKQSIIAKPATPVQILPKPVTVSHQPAAVGLLAENMQMTSNLVQQRMPAQIVSNFVPSNQNLTQQVASGYSPQLVKTSPISSAANLVQMHQQHPQQSQLQVDMRRLVHLPQDQSTLIVCSPSQMAHQAGVLTTTAVPVFQQSGRQTNEGIASVLAQPAMQVQQQQQLSQPQLPSASLIHHIPVASQVVQSQSQLLQQQQQVSPVVALSTASVTNVHGSNAAVPAGRVMLSAAAPVSQQHVLPSVGAVGRAQGVSVSIQHQHQHQLVQRQVVTTTPSSIVTQKQMQMIAQRQQQQQKQVSVPLQPIQVQQQQQSVGIQQMQPVVLSAQTAQQQTRATTPAAALATRQQQQQQQQVTTIRTATGAPAPTLSQLQFVQPHQQKLTQSHVVVQTANTQPPQPSTSAAKTIAPQTGQAQVHLKQVVSSQPAVPPSQPVKLEPNKAVVAAAAVASSLPSKVAVTQTSVNPAAANRPLQQLRILNGSGALQGQQQLTLLQIQPGQPGQPTHLQAQTPDGKIIQLRLIPSSQSTAAATTMASALNSIRPVVASTSLHGPVKTVTFQTSKGVKRSGTDLSLLPPKKLSGVLGGLQNDHQVILQTGSKTPFTDRRDAIRRLLSYHICDDSGETDPAAPDYEEAFEVVSCQLVSKFTQMKNKFQQLLFHDAQLEALSSERVMAGRLYLNDEKQHLAQLNKKLSEERQRTVDEMGEKVKEKVEKMPEVIL